MRRLVRRRGASAQFRRKEIFWKDDKTHFARRANDQGLAVTGYDILATPVGYDRLAHAYRRCEALLLPEAAILNKMFDDVPIHAPNLTSVLPKLQYGKCEVIRTSVLPKLQRMTLGQRIRTLRKARGIRQSDMARALNVAPNTFSDWENGKHHPSREKTKQLAEFLQISLAELELGYDPDAEVDVRDDLGELVFVPEYRTRVAAGGGIVVEEGEKSHRWPWPRSFFDTEIRAKPSDCGVLEVYGDSMEPTLRSGDRILANFARRNPARPGIYVLSQLGEAVVKRLELIPGSKPPRLRVSSDNPLHHAYEVDASDVEIIGWVEIRVTRV